ILIFGGDDDTEPIEGQAPLHLDTILMGIKLHGSRRTQHRQPAGRSVAEQQCRAWRSVAQRHAEACLWQRRALLEGKLDEYAVGPQQQTESLSDVAACPQLELERIGDAVAGANLWRDQRLENESRVLSALRRKLQQREADFDLLAADIVEQHWQL